MKQIIKVVFSVFNYCKFFWDIFNKVIHNEKLFNIPTINKLWCILNEHSYVEFKYFVFI